MGRFLRRMRSLARCLRLAQRCTPCHPRLGLPRRLRPMSFWPAHCTRCQLARGPPKLMYQLHRGWACFKLQCHRRRLLSAACRRLRLLLRQARRLLDRRLRYRHSRVCRLWTPSRKNWWAHCRLPLAAQPSCRGRWMTSPAGLLNVRLGERLRRHCLRAAPPTQRQPPWYLT